MNEELSGYLLPLFTVRIFRGRIDFSSRTRLMSLAPGRVSKETTMASRAGFTTEGP